MEHFWVVSKRAAASDVITHPRAYARNLCAVLRMNFCTVAGDRLLLWHVLSEVEPGRTIVLLHVRPQGLFDVVSAAHLVPAVGSKAPNMLTNGNDIVYMLAGAHVLIAGSGAG